VGVPWGGRVVRSLAHVEKLVKGQIESKFERGGGAAWVEGE